MRNTDELIKEAMIRIQISEDRIKNLESQLRVERLFIQQEKFLIEWYKETK